MNLEEYIKLYYGKEKAKDIAEKFNVNIYKIYRTAKQLNIYTNKKTNKTFIITKIAEQILLSGKFGDGNFRKMGLGAIYREKHALDEKDYCIWKFTKLGELTQQNRLYYYKDKYINFDTSNSKQLLYYINTPKIELITKLNELGLLLYFLDDGWVLKRKGYYAGNISSVKLSFEEMNLLATKFRNLCECTVKVSQWHKQDGSSPLVIYIQDISTLIEIAKEYKMQGLDIFKKKFNK